MNAYTINKINAPSVKNEGIIREWSLCRHYNIFRTTHDKTPYNVGSDIDIGNKHISVKASAFSLMSGSLCEGLTDFDAIWNLFECNVHSNMFAYVTADYTVYEMNIVEFKKFVYAFCGVEHESDKNGGLAKIKCRKESGKMLKWLENMAQAT